jgi:hypothetical protein
MMFGAYRNGVVKTNNEVPGGWSAIRKCVLSSALFWRVKVPLALK